MMFPVPRGWKLERGGGRRVLVPPHGGSIAIDEGLRPVGTVCELVRKLDLPRDFSLEDSVEDVVTSEGEYGALARGRAGRATFSFGFVFLDESYVRLIGVAPEGAGIDIAGPVREILLATRAHLGNPRRRRFRCQPPPGWQPVDGGDERTWLPPGYPRPCSSITVLPAIPTTARGGP